MIHPSYNELIEIINENNENGENPEINSRYSIVMAAAKRARQLIGQGSKISKPLSTAVEELRTGAVVITEEGEDDFQYHLMNSDNAADIVYDDENEAGDGDIELDGAEDTDSEDADGDIAE